STRPKASAPSVSTTSTCASRGSAAMKHWPTSSGDMERDDDHHRSAKRRELERRTAARARSPPATILVSPARADTNPYGVLCPDAGRVFYRRSTAGIGCSQPGED